MSTLYIVATPIGNLEDMSFRALRILGEVDFILCEDTRITRRLLEHYNIKTPAISYHQHSDIKKTKYILGLLTKGKNLALVSDAGTPGVSDPGGKLVQAVIERLGDDVSIESVPGPSAVTAALSISGIPTDRFIFMGFPPHKKGRRTFIRKVIESEWPVVVYESKHRIIKFLEELERTAKNPPPYEGGGRGRFRIGTQPTPPLCKGRELSSVVVCRELSKLHETVYRGDIKTIVEKIKASKDAQRGEFVVIIGK